MQLSDHDIKNELDKGTITISPFDLDRLQPASYDVLLGNDFLIFNYHAIEIIDPKSPTSNLMTKVSLKDYEAFILQPGKFALGATKDVIGVNNNFACQINGKSSLARLGLIIHTTAGFIDPGNKLNITLELYNTNSVPIKLYAGMKIAQVAFYQLRSPSEKAYGDKSLNSKYYGSTGVEASKMHLNFKA